MSREWKPGDVAMRDGELAFLTDRGVWRWSTTGLPCLAQDHARSRPLVVIDPEDREQVEQLIRLQDIAFDGSARDPVIAADVRDMQAALREFADPKPPRPEEPTGLGAVVEDAAGELWLRSYLPGEDADVLGKPWKNGPVCKNWQIVDAVRVLSEGVQR